MGKKGTGYRKVHTINDAAQRRYIVVITGIYGSTRNETHYHNYKI